MIVPMIIVLVITVLMIILIMIERLSFGAPPLLVCLLLVLFGVVDIKTAFASLSNAAIVMPASFMAIIVALQKTSFITAFKNTIYNMASKGGYKSYVLLVPVAMLGTSLFGTGSTAYYVLTPRLLPTTPYNPNLSSSKIIMPAGFAANRPLILLNVALQYGIVVAALQSAGAAVGKADIVRFTIVNLIPSLAFLAWCLVTYKSLPDHPIAETTEDAKAQGENVAGMPKWKEYTTYFAFLAAVVGMILQSKAGDTGCVVPGPAVALLLAVGAMDFKEIRDAICSPIILMFVGVIGVTGILGNTGLTALVGESVANVLGSSTNPFVLVLAFCALISVLATLTGSTLGTVYVFASLAISTYLSLGLNPTAAAAAIVVFGWNGHFLPIDGMPAVIMGTGKYKLTEFWKSAAPMYFIRSLVLSAGALLTPPM